MRDIVILGGSAGMVVVFHHLRREYPELKIAVVDEMSEADMMEVCGEQVPVSRDWNFDAARAFHGLDDTAFKEFLILFTYPKVKKILVEKALAHGLTPAPTFVHPATEIIPPVTIGRGGFIGKGCDLASDAVIGDYICAGNAVIGHHVTVGDYCTIGTNTALLGFSQLGEGVQVSPGAIVRTGVNIAPWVTIGINAAVVADIPEPGITVGGVPAKPLKSAEKTE